jgi:uncharacterized protein (DUF1330 family)
MAACYLIVNYDVTDPDLYKEYQKGAGPALMGQGAQLVVFDPASRQIEGDGAGRQTVVMKFASREEAERVYHSEQYQAVVGKRLAATAKHFALLVDEFSMPGSS